ncbi:MAG: lysine 2,3-aminomutase [Elusimicrobia bacterium]|nr:lysine 2,3-aminomutase [Elusimicrobiota bacterium]
MQYPTVDYKKVPLFAKVSQSDWNDWRWQLSHVIKDIPTLERVISLDASEKNDLKRCLAKFRMAITPYYAALMDARDRQCPVRLQAVPSIEELRNDPDDLDDPLHEDVDSPVPGLTHRYPDRVLLLVTNICSMNCRHCTRRRMVGFEDTPLSKACLDKAVKYISGNKAVRDVLISGGDPLTLSDDHLESILQRLRAIKHVEIIRIGTRVPVVMPMRVTEKLAAMLRKYHPLYINTHFNHSKEMTAEARLACARLADAGIPLGNQSVLLRGVNDSQSTMKKLVHNLLMARVKPYYIYQCDLSKGISHFRTSVSKGIEIVESLRGHTTGMAVPTYVVDAPGGGGKIPVMPSYMISQSDKKIVLRNYEGGITSYSLPQVVSRPSNSDTEYASHEGIAALLNGDKRTLEPADLKRRKRGH